MAETRHLFGTDGVRGVANVYPMTAEVALQLGRALAFVIKYGPGRHRIVVGKDTRLSATSWSMPSPPASAPWGSTSSSWGRCLLQASPLSPTHAS